MSNQRAPHGHRHQKEKRSRKSTPKIYLNLNARLKTLTFRPQNAVINSAELSAIQAAETQPRNFSMPLIMNDIIKILLVEDHRIHIQSKVCKYLLVHDRFRNSMLKFIAQSKEDIALYVLKADRAKLMKNKVKWTRKADDEANYYNNLLNFRDMLLEQSKVDD